MQKLDFYQAAKAALKENNIFRLYFSIEENLTLENFDAQKGTRQYEVTETAIACGLIAEDGILANGEEAFRLTTEREREKFGERHLSADSKTYIIKAGKYATTLSNMFDEGLKAVEENAALEKWEK